jgi:hypothetical protein
MNTEEKSEDHFRKIPPLCFQIIFSYLNPQDIGKLACVSKKLKTESEKDIHWARFPFKTKAQYSEFMMRPFITIVNKGPEIIYEMGVAAGTGEFKTDHPKIQSFSVFKKKFKIEKDKENIIRYFHLPPELWKFFPINIYGLTTLPSTVIYGNFSSIQVEQWEISDPSIIWEIIGSSSKFMLSEEFIEGRKRIALQEMKFHPDS